MSVVLLISNETENHLLLCLARKCRQLRHRAIQRGLTPISPRRKTSQTIKKRLLSKNFTGLYYYLFLIFKRWWNTDVYREATDKSYTQPSKKHINRLLFCPNYAMSSGIVRSKCKVSTG